MYSWCKCFPGVRVRYSHRYAGPDDRARCFGAMSGDDSAEMAALAAEFGLSDRGAQATKPPFSYLHAFFKAMAEPWEAGTQPEGYINLAVAQNFLTVDVVQERLRKAMASEQPDSTAAYDNMRGSERLRTAMAVRSPRLSHRAPHLSSPVLFTCRRWTHE